MTEIHAGHLLLKAKFPFVDGLHDTAITGTLVTPAISEFVQIINTGNGYTLVPFLTGLEELMHTGGLGGVLPYIGYIGMCRCEGYGFQAFHSSIGYINQSIWVYNRVSFFTKLRKPGIAT